MVETKGKIRVFVYGTLKKGHPLHEHVLEKGRNVEFVRRDYIEEPLMMCSMGAFPALVYDDYGGPNETYRVFGEVYTVDDETLASMDFAEGHPKFYKRRKVRTKQGDMNCWVYVLTDPACDYADEYIEEGVWKPHEGEKAYVAANQRG